MKGIMDRAQRAIYQLDLHVDHSSTYDNLQLAQILVQILDYPDIMLAQNHAIANKTGSYDLFQNRSQLAKDLQQNQSNTDGTPICECCGLILHKQTVPFCTPLHDINVGLGTRLYFNSLLYSASVFTVVSVLFSIYFIVTNVEACHDTLTNCGIQGISLSYKMIDVNIYTGYLYTSSILGIILVSFWGIIDVVKHHQQRKIGIQLASKFIQASEFTMMLYGFPLSLLKTSYQQNLKTLNKIFLQYEQNMNSKIDYKIVKINIARNLYIEREKSKQRKNKLIQKLKQKQTIFKQWIVHRKHHNKFFSTIQQRQQSYDDYLNFYINEFDAQEIYKGEEDQSVIVFVTFEQSKARQEIQFNARSPNILNCFNLFHTNHFPLPNVKIRKSPPPQQIKWTNIGFPYTSKLLRGVLVYTIALLFLAGSLGMTYGLSQVQTNRSQIWISILISIVITSVNLCLQFIIMVLSKYLNQITQSNIQFNIAFKICLFQILNVIGVPMLALYISKRKLYGEDGLSQDIFFIALFNILPPLGRFIDPYYILVTIRNKIYQRPNYRLTNYQSQKQFNQIYEDNDFDLGYQYAYLIKTSIFTSFFISLQPIISIFAVAGLMLMFWVNKYRILYRFFKPRYYSSTVNSLVNYLLGMSPMFFGLGMLVFVNWQKEYYFTGTLYLNWAIFIIGGFFFFFPFRLLYKCITEPIYPELKYSHTKPILQSQYDRMNPLTRSKAIDQHQTYLKQLQNKKQLPVEARVINQNLRRSTIPEMMRSRISMIEDLRCTIRGKQIEEMKQSGIQHFTNGSSQIIQSKLMGHDNMGSYTNFMNFLHGKSELRQI